MNKVLLGLMLFVSVSAYAEEFPVGLRLPTKEELAKEPMRKESPTKYARVTADFNGDGKPDYAFILIGVKNRKMALAVKLSNENGYDWKIIEKDQFDWDFPMAIELAKPGKYETACGSGMVEGCAKDEPKSITLKNPGFFYGPMDSGGGGIVFWNSKKMIFEQVITSAS